MDLYVERQCVEKLRKGQLDQFITLFDSYFADLYRYVRRRVSDSKEVEKIVRLSFLDALNKYGETPVDSNFVVWLYTLAWPRVSSYINNSSANGEVLNAMDNKNLEDSEKSIRDKAEHMFGKLTLEEREILMLKFFEEVSDGDIMQILNIDEASVGPRIYKVLKRAHFLLYGESNEKQGVYFGELSGFLIRVRDLELIEIPDAFKLSLKADLSSKISRKDMAIDAELVEERNEAEAAAKQKVVNGTGSNDPAKIFVEAAKGMDRDDVMRKVKQRRREERAERLGEVFWEIFDQWKGVIFGLPIILLLAVGTYIAWNGLGFGKISRGAPTICEAEVSFDGDFGDGEKMHINKFVSDRLCEHFDVENLLITDSLEDGIEVEVMASSDLMLEYRFVRIERGWKIKKYVRNTYSNRQSGKV
ncbi:hypothetical protein GF354_03585 [Candidatus Peregrinibacteria bacterium]|nr:hypothetical protein [Candidatus Peregrinibacteria bacterium]